MNFRLTLLQQTSDKYCFFYKIFTIHTNWLELGQPFILLIKFKLSFFSFLKVRPTTSGNKTKWQTHYTAEAKIHAKLKLLAINITYSNTLTVTEKEIISQTFHLINFTTMLMMI